MKRFIDWLFGTSHPEIKKYHEERNLKVIEREFYDLHKGYDYSGFKLDYVPFKEPYKRKKKPNWMYQCPHW
jgi:hypothetical protein